jgi:hypothetical protein
MADKPDKPTRRRWPWAAALLLVFVVYPLSAGPVYCVSTCLFRLSVIPSDLHGLVREFYVPVWWLASQSETTWSLANWYVSWWLRLGLAVMPP